MTTFGLLSTTLLLSLRCGSCCEFLGVGKEVAEGRTNGWGKLSLLCWLRRLRSHRWFLCSIGVSQETPIEQAQKRVGVGRGLRGQGQKGGYREATLHQPVVHRFASKGGTKENVSILQRY